MSRRLYIGSAVGVVLLVASGLLLWGLSNETTASANSETPAVSVFARRSELPRELANLCRVRGSDQTVFVPFSSKDHKITLMLREEYASFPIAQDVVDLINASELIMQNTGIPLAKAVDAGNVEVAVPERYRDDIVLFFAQILRLEMREPETSLDDLCQLMGQEETVFSPSFTSGHGITLVLAEEYASYQTAQNVVELINSSELTFQNNGIPLAKAIDTRNVEVQIPRQYAHDEVLFFSEILRLRMVVALARENARK